MGNYKKTVKCSWCHNHGHNKITCEKLKKYINSLKEKYGEDNTIVKEYLLTKTNYSQKSSKNATKKRACTYCQELGHNRRTCVWLKKHKNSLLEQNYNWRSHVVKIMKRNGIAAGSLITHDYGEDRSYTFNFGILETYDANDIWMIIKINWSEINYFNPCDASFTLSLMKRPSTKKRVSLESLVLCNSGEYHSSDCNWKIISRSENLNVPDKWLMDDLAIVTKVDTYFKDLTKASFEKIFSDEEINNLLNVILEAGHDRQKR